MGRLALVVGGHWDGLSPSLGEADEIGASGGREPDGHARAAVLERRDCVVLVRHSRPERVEGPVGYVLPHEIDHPGNMRALVEAGCDRVLAIGSAGGLRPELGPGTFVCPDDFIALDVPHHTSLTGMAAHRVPGFDHGWRAEVLAAFEAASGEARVEVLDGGVYWQVRGPRLETPAEIRLVAQRAEVIGMTIGAECVAAGEAGLRYAAVCLVDNYANGVAETELTLAELEAGRARNREALARALAAVLPRLA